MGWCDGVKQFWEIGNFLVLLSTFSYLVLWLEKFLVRVFNGGKVTVPKQLRERFDVEDGDYLRLVLVEVLKKAEGEWVRRRVE